jgi:Uma2 family endonuclease
MASAISAPPITIDQYLLFKSPAGYHDELINGRIIVSPDPKPLHLDIAENLFHLLRAAVGSPYKVGQRINLYFPSHNSMPSPDVFVIDRVSWNNSRAANEYPAGSKVLLAAEVVSPGNRSGSIRKKAEIYQKNGIELWVVYPNKQQVKVYRPGHPVMQFLANDDAVLSLPPMLPQSTIKITEIFAL